MDKDDLIILYLMLDGLPVTKENIEALKSAEGGENE